MERRRLSSADRPRDAVQRQHERIDYERLTLPPTSRAKCQEFLDFWKITLGYGGAWFTAAWPTPRGQAVRLARKFLEQPKWEFIAGGFWRISAMCEVRGGPVGDECFLEQFRGGLGEYTTSGDTSIFSVITGGIPASGKCLRVGAQGGGSAYIERETTGLYEPAVKFSGDFRLEALTTDDSCGAYLLNAAGNQVLGFVPRSSVGTDAMQRPAVDYTPGGFLIGSAALSAGVWYRFKFTLLAGSGQSTVEIRRVADLAIIASATLSGSHPPFDAAGCRFFIDSSALTAETYYDNIEVCPHA